MTPRIQQLAAKCERIRHRIARKKPRHENTGDDLAQLKATRLAQLKAEIRYERKRHAA